MRYVFESLRPGGYFSLWENKPWNPGTRFAMHRCAFDQDGVDPGQSHQKFELSRSPLFLGGRGHAMPFSGHSLRSGLRRTMLILDFRRQQALLPSYSSENGIE